MYRSFYIVREHTLRPLGCSFYRVAVGAPAVGSQWWPNCQRTSCSGPAPTHALEHARTYTHTLQRRTGFPIRRRGTLDLDKPRQEPVTKGPLSARETLTVMEMIPSLCGVEAQERISGLIRKWRQTKTRTERTRPEVPPPASSPGILSRQCSWFLDRLTSTSGRRDYSQREELSSAPLPGVAASTRRRATRSVHNGSDSRAPTFNGKAKPRRVDKKGGEGKDVALVKAHRNNTSAATELIRRAAVPHCCADSMSASLSWERVRCSSPALRRRRGPGPKSLEWGTSTQVTRGKHWRDKRSKSRSQYRQVLRFPPPIRQTKQN